MATRAIFLPFAAEFPASNFPALSLNNRRPVLAFDAATKETCYWTGIAPQGLTGTLTLVITYIMASATSGDVVWNGSIEAITSGDASPDLDAATSFDTANAVTTTVPGTAGLMKQASITLTNADAMAAADYIRVQLDRDAANGSDTAAGDAQVLAVELRDAA